MLNEIKRDCRSVTGLNLRRILSLMNKNDVGDLFSNDANNLVYKEIPPNEEWKIGFMKEITEIKYGEFTLEGFTKEELDVMLFEICVQ